MHWKLHWSERYRGAMKSSWIGLLLCLAAPVAWIATLDQPFLRRTGLAAFVLCALGLALLWQGKTKDGRKRSSVMLGLGAAVTLLLVLGGFVLTRLPAAGFSQRFASQDAKAQAFELPDQTGQSVALSGVLEKGPVLLVFYRGSW